MSTPTKSDNSQLVDCEICAKLVPASEAKVAEAIDYFVHFCGLECYDLWQKKIQQDQASQSNQANRAGSSQP